MKNIVIAIVILSSLILFNCKKDELSDRFQLLTTPVWIADSLLADGVDVRGPGELLENFTGEAKFNKDGTGLFGIYTGNWELAYNDTQIIISTDSIPFPVAAEIDELTATSLKINTAFPNVYDPSIPIKIRMTFKSK